MKLFIVSFWSKVFSALRWLSLWRIVITCIPSLKGDFFFTECWVFGHFVFFILTALLSALGLHWLEPIAIYYGALRVVEIIVFQAHSLLVVNYAVKSFRRTVVLLLHNYVEIILWFAIVYLNLRWTIECNAPTALGFFDSLNLSFVTMTTFGQTGLRPAGDLEKILILLQAAIGLFMALVIFARTISLLPLPGTLDKSEKSPG